METIISPTPNKTKKNITTHLVAIKPSRDWVGDEQRGLAVLSLGVDVDATVTQQAGHRFRGDVVGARHRQHQRSLALCGGAHVSIATGANRALCTNE